MPLTLEQIFEYVNQSVVQLSFRWKIYCELFDSGPDNIAVLNASGAEVFCLFQKLALDDAILALSRLTDPASCGKNKDNANINYLLKNAAPSLAQDINTELQAIFECLEKHVQNLSVHRDKALAHTDLQHALQLETLPPVLYDELESAMKECRNLMSKLGQSLFTRTYCYEVTIPFGRSGSDLLAHLRRSHTRPTNQR
jgi:hypothetical protein